MLHNFLVPEINRRGINQQTMWFQQELSWQLCEKSFLRISFLSAVIFHGLPGHLT
jgi:hypothetical protein